MSQNFTNLKIRNALMMNGLCHWELAEYLEINPATLARKLRRELPDEKQAEYLEAISAMSGIKERRNNAEE
jgi:ribosome-binding protein aMBF1 (putative translation factor)